MWKRELLEEACTFISRGISPKYTEEGGVLVINQKCVRNHTIDYSLARRHDIEKKNVKPERFIQRGDVLINSTGQGTLGRVAQVRDEPPEPTTVDSHVTIVRPNLEKFYLDYFGYALIQIEDELKNSGQGTSGQTELAKTRVQKEFFASYPSDKSEQQRIVAKLDAAFAEIDKAIEAASKNIKSIKILFDAELVAQFKNLTNTSKIVPIADTCEDIFAGGDAPKDAFSKFKTDEFNIPIFANAAKKKGLYGFTDTPRVHVPAVTIAGRGSGTGYTEIRLEPFLPIVRLIVLLPNPEIVSIEYLKKAILSLDVLSSGSAIPQLTVPMIKSYKIPIPTLEEQRDLIEKLNEIELKVSLLAHNYSKKIASHNSLKSAILAQELQSEAA